MNKMKVIHPDELPEKCRNDIRRFFEKPHSDSDFEDVNGSVLYRNPDDYIILAKKESKSSSSPGWQASFLQKSDFEAFKQYHSDYSSAYYIVSKKNKEHFKS